MFYACKNKILFFSLTVIAWYLQSHEKYVSKYFFLSLLLWQKSRTIRVLLDEVV